MFYVFLVYLSYISVSDSPLFPFKAYSLKLLHYEALHYHALKESNRQWLQHKVTQKI